MADMNTLGPLAFVLPSSFLPQNVLALKERPLKGVCIFINAGCSEGLQLHHTENCLCFPFLLPDIFLLSLFLNSLIYIYEVFNHAQSSYPSFILSEPTLLPNSPLLASMFSPFSFCNPFVLVSFLPRGHKLGSP